MPCNGVDTDFAAGGRLHLRPVQSARLCTLLGMAAAEQYKNQAMCCIDSISDDSLSSGSTD